MQIDLEAYVAEVVDRFLPKDAKIVVGLSGGLDSMVLTHILDKLGYKLILANCNFGLRGKEADRDSSFVRDICTLRWPHQGFVCVTFNTKKVASEKGISDEMAAREMRYSWLKGIMETYSAQAIALGHHRTDQVETILLNMLRGTGVKGLLGMDEWRDPLLRPMLGLKKDQLKEYAEENDIPYVIDSTNRLTIYKRNKVRLELLPLMREFNPSIEDSLYRSAEFWKQEHNVFLTKYNEFAEKAITRSGQRLNMHELLKSTSPEAFLHEFLSDFSFASDVVSDILQAPFSSGRRFLNRDHSWEAELFRGALYLSSHLDDEEQSVTVPKIDGIWHIGDGVISTSLISLEDVGMYERGYVYYDADKLPDTILFRTLRVKDSFVPMGMRGRKDVGDFLKDHGVPSIFRVYYLVSEFDDEICGVLPFRVSESVKITPSTRNIFRVKWEHPCHSV